MTDKCKMTGKVSDDLTCLWMEATKLYLEFPKDLPELLKSSDEVIQIVLKDPRLSKYPSLLYGVRSLAEAKDAARKIKILAERVRNDLKEIQSKTGWFPPSP